MRTSYRFAIRQHDATKAQVITVTVIAGGYRFLSTHRHAMEADLLIGLGRPHSDAVFGRSQDPSAWGLDCHNIGDPYRRRLCPDIR